MKLATIKELCGLIVSGKIKEEELGITLDNDNTSFYIEKDEDEESYEEIEIAETNGYNDIEPLYKLLFPKAKVNWC